MRDSRLQDVVNKLQKYKDETNLSKRNSTDIDRIIDILGVIEPSRISIPNVSIADSTKAQMIKFFYDKYHDTDQDAATFSEEFYFVVGEISMGMIPIKLEFLTNFLEDFDNTFPEFKFKQKYYQVEDLINEDRKEREMPF